VIQTLGVWLIFFAVALRGGILFSGEPEGQLVMSLLLLYGLLLLLEMLIIRQRLAGASASQPPRPWLLVTYLVLQSTLVVGLLVITTAEDFFSLLFIPLSLDAVTFFGRRLGFACIAIFALLITLLMLNAQEGRLFGLAMGMFFSSLCFLFGAYAYQVQKANAGTHQNQLMLEELQLAHRQLQGYEDQLASLAIEQERNRLARDLHDSVTQTVFSMNLAAQSARLLLDRDARQAAGQLLPLEELAASAQREIQALIAGLRPHRLAETGLQGALRQLASERTERDRLDVRLDVTGERALSEAEAAALYAIAQEGLTNVLKHSGGCEALIRLDLKPDQSRLVIEDHGLGFDPAVCLKQRGHLGLAGMSDRAREIGWSLSVESRPGNGTRIIAMENPPGVAP
jgi:signal transduction histidine kinase